jgi:crotonobetainyl-CoA:carnitine CoA-transferase CaiB-like acyl-CoA transferase
VTGDGRSRAEALDGIRVIDCGQYIAGPLAAMFLAD